MEAIANLKKRFVINPVQNVLEMAVLGANAGQETICPASFLMWPFPAEIEQFKQESKYVKYC